MTMRSGIMGGLSGSCSILVCRRAQLCARRGRPSRDPVRQCVPFFAKKRPWNVAWDILTETIRAKPTTLTPGNHAIHGCFWCSVNMPDWRACEGQLLDGKYPLERYVGGDEASALFLIGSASSAVRIRRADAAAAAA